MKRNTYTFRGDFCGEDCRQLNFVLQKHFGFSNVEVSSTAFGQVFVETENSIDIEKYSSIQDIIWAVEAA